MLYKNVAESLQAAQEWWRLPETRAKTWAGAEEEQGEQGRWTPRGTSPAFPGSPQRLGWDVGAARRASAHNSITLQISRAFVGNR